MNLLNTIGNTPLIRVGRIYAKLETLNPSGSIKDRIAWYMIKKAEQKGYLRKGSEIMEATSGNTGISFAMVSAIKGYKFSAVMPENGSAERVKMMKAFGARVYTSPKEEGMAGAVKKLKKISKGKKVWIPNQFENPDNIEAHEKTTGKEILSQVKKVDVFVAGIGTGGTLIGVAKALKKVHFKVKIIGLEPAESPIISKGISGYHEIEGIGEGFIPKVVKDNLEIMDEIKTVKSVDAKKMSVRLARKYGLMVGISSGANVLTAFRLSKKYKNVVTILPDRGERYLSTDLFN